MEGWTSFRGSCYKLVEEIVDWENASQVCYQSGAHLTSILDDWEEFFITLWLKSKIVFRKHYSTKHI